MRALGLAAVFLACLGFGAGAARAQALALRSLEDLCRALYGLREELAARLSPVEELLRAAAARSEGEAKPFFLAMTAALAALGERSFDELWREACRAFLPHLPEAPRRELDGLGASLGRAALPDQLAALDRFLRLAEEERRARSGRLPEQRRLALALGGAAGAFLCLLIL